MSRVPSLFASLMLASLAGCNLVGTVHPLSDAKTSIDDDRLLGEWVPVDPKTKAPANEERLQIRKAAEGHAYEVTSANKDDQTTFFVAEIDKRHFLSAPLKGDPPIRYQILQYDLRGDELQLFLLDPVKTAAAIDEGLVEGTVTRETPPADRPSVHPNLKKVVLTASSDQLRQFFGTKGGQAVIYTDEPAMILKRAPK